MLTDQYIQRPILIRHEIDNTLEINFDTFLFSLV